MAAMVTGVDGEIYVAVGGKGSTKDGNAWDDGVGGQVKMIFVWHGDLIHGIQTTYERHGSTLVSRRHGGTEGDFDLINGADGEIYIAVGPKGSTEYGNTWDDSVGGQVKQIFIWHGDLIHGIQATYERHGSTFVSPRHGGTEGDFDQVCLDGPLVRVSGTYGSYCIEPDVFADEEDAPYNYIKVIRSLKFETSTGSTYGPFGCEVVGELFSFKASNGISGLHGRSSDGSYGYLYAIGVYIRTMATGLIERPLVGALVASGSSAVEGLVKQPPAAAALPLKSNIDEYEI